MTADRTAALEQINNMLGRIGDAAVYLETAGSMYRPGAQRELKEACEAVRSALLSTAKEADRMREALEHALNRLEGAAKVMRANNLGGCAGNVDIDIKEVREIAALLPSEGTKTWHPIATAPKNGKWILVWGKGEYGLVRWNGSNWDNDNEEVTNIGTHWRYPEPPPSEGTRD